jgi:hypothetical protein
MLPADRLVAFHFSALVRICIWRGIEIGSKMSELSSQPATLKISRHINPIRWIGSLSSWCKSEDLHTCEKDPAIEYSNSWAGDALNWTS